MISKVKLGPSIYKIVEESGLAPTHGLWGQIRYDEKTIAIEKNLGLAQKQESILHEIVHGLFFLSGEGGGDEKTVVVLSLHLLSFLRDNVDLVNYLLEESE